MQFENNNFFKAFFFSTVRILRCNPLFEGGFDYVKVKSPAKTPLNLEFKKIKVKYWLVPVDQNQCYILKHNKKWDK